MIKLHKLFPRYISIDIINIILYYYELFEICETRKTFSFLLPVWIDYMTQRRSIRLRHYYHSIAYQCRYPTLCIIRYNCKTRARCIYNSPDGVILRATENENLCVKRTFCNSMTNSLFAGQSVRSLDRLRLPQTFPQEKKGR